MIIPAVYEHVRAIVAKLGHADWAALPDHGDRLQRVVADIPPAVWHKVSNEVATRYRSLEERYGRSTAIAIVAAGIVGSAVPLPGTTVLAVAPLIALAELHHRLSAESGVSGAIRSLKTRLAESEIRQLGGQWVHDLADVLRSEGGQEHG